MKQTITYVTQPIYLSGKKVPFYGRFIFLIANTEYRSEYVKYTNSKEKEHKIRDYIRILYKIVESKNFSIMYGSTDKLTSYLANQFIKGRITEIEIKYNNFYE